MSTTLSQLITRVRQRAELESSTFVTDSEVTEYINSSLGELWDLVVKAYGEDYSITTSGITTSDGTAAYSIPSNFYKLAGVDFQDSNGSVYTMRKYNFRDRNRFQNTVWLTDIPESGFKYRIVGETISITPTPDGAYNISLHYIPRSTYLVNDSDTVDNILLDTWLEYVVVDAAIKCKVKEESDISSLVFQKNALIKRLETMISDRDINEPDTVLDIERYRYWRF